jgi:hypothetical protein
MKQNNNIDWEGVEKDYRAGILSIREIGRRYDCSEGIIRKNAKKKGWQRDLTEKVRERVRTKMVRKRVRKDNAYQDNDKTDEEIDEEIIEESADEAVKILELHRKDIEKLREIEQKLIADLSGEPKKTWVGQYQGEIVDGEYDLTISEKAMAANNLANVQHKRIQLERQAYKLNDEDEIEELLIKVKKFYPKNTDNGQNSEADTPA